MTKVKKWFPIESNPSILNKYLDTMGFPTTTYEFQDVLSTEEWALEMVPQPVAAVIFLFPIKDEVCNVSISNGKMFSFAILD